MKKFVYILFIWFGLTSCEKYEPVKLDLPFKPKAVAVCFLETGSNHVEVSLIQTSNPLEGIQEMDPVYITDAQLEIETPRGRYPLTYNEFSRFYELYLDNEVIETEQTYQLYVTYQNEVISGKTLTPSIINPAIHITFDSVYENNIKHYVATINCKIYEPGKHHISLNAILVLEDSSQIILTTDNFSENDIHSIVSGETLVKRFKEYQGNLMEKPVRIDVYAAVYNDDYATYDKLAKTSDWGGETPFGEPIIMPSNMSNKVGMLGAYKPLNMYTVFLP